MDGTNTINETIFDYDSEGVPLMRIRKCEDVPMAVVADTIANGASMAKDELLLLLRYREAAPLQEPELVSKPVCKHNIDCMNCKAFVTVVSRLLPDSTYDLELYMCPNAGRKMTEGVKLSALAAYDDEAGWKYAQFVHAQEERGRQKSEEANRQRAIALVAEEGEE